MTVDTADNVSPRAEARSSIERSPRDDRVLPETRIALALIVPFLIIAFVMLYIWPDDTDRLFAWTIKPRMTALLMGAGYIGGAYFIARAIWAQRWHEIQIGFLPITIFASSMGLATVLHWDRFNHDHVSFYAWSALYATTPFIILGIWLRNRRRDPGPFAQTDVGIPVQARRASATIGILILAVGCLLILVPDVMIRHWPWQLSPLTARVVGGWFLLPGVFGVLIARDPRWSAARLALQSQAFGIGLILVGVARARDDFDHGSIWTWVFVVGLAGLLVVIVILYLTMELTARMLRPRPSVGQVS